MMPVATGGPAGAGDSWEGERAVAVADVGWGLAGMEVATQHLHSTRVA